MGVFTSFATVLSIGSMIQRAKIVSICGTPIVGDVWIHAGDKLKVTPHGGMVTTLVIEHVDGRWTLIEEQS